MRPTLTVKVGTGDLEWKIKALIDTGAPACVFPRGAAEALDLEMDPTVRPRIPVDMVGKRWAAIRHVVDVTLPDFPEFTWDAPVLFLLDDWPMPFGIMGQEGFLDRWAVSFNFYGGYFVIEPADQFAQNLPIDSFAEFQNQFDDDWERPSD